MDSPHEGPVTQKMFPLDDVIAHHAAYQLEIFVDGIDVSCAIHKPIEIAQEKKRFPFRRCLFEPRKNLPSI